MKLYKKLLFTCSIFLILIINIYILISNKDISKINSPKSGALEALSFWNRSRAYPQNDIPSTKYYKAYKEKERIIVQSKNTIDENQPWESIGPSNIPGRIISIALNPMNRFTLYAGSASGGLWRTMDARTGNDWHRIETGFPTLGVNAIAINPIDTNTIYIGTGEVYKYKKSNGGTIIRTMRGSYGIGILKTTDYGQTWSKSLDWTHHQERGVQCLRINPKDPKCLYAATTEGIYKSNDAGDSWSLILPVLMGQDIIIHPTDTAKVMVSCGNFASEGAGIYSTYNSGQTWTKFTDFPDFTGKTTLEYYRSDPNIVYASIADSLYGKGLYRSIKFGARWERLQTFDVPEYQGWFSHWVSVHPLDSSKVLLAGVQLFNTSNGGRLIGAPAANVHVDHHCFVHDPVSPDILYIGCDGGVYKTDDFGNRFINIGYGLQTSQFYNGFSSSIWDSALAMGGLQDNSITIFRGTKDWQRVLGGDGCWTAINQADDNILYASMQYNNIFKSTNRGFSFFSATTGIDPRDLGAFVSPFVISPSNPDVLYAGKQKIYKSITGASNWVTLTEDPLDGNPALSMAISANNPDIVYVGTAPIKTRSHIYKTIDGGNSWINITDSLPDRYPMDIAVDPFDNNIIYVVYGGFSSGHIYKSTDGGMNWSDISGDLPDIPTLAIAIDPLQTKHIYLGNDLGVYVSTNADENWSLFTDGLPESVIAMDLSISDANRTIRVATHGNGAYQRKLLFQPDQYIICYLNNLPSVNLVGNGQNFNLVLKNYGNDIQQDTLHIQIRVIDENKTECFNYSQSFCCLEGNSIEKHILEKRFVPTEGGIYQIQLIKELDSLNFPPDTVEYYIHIIPIPSLKQVKVSKKHSQYSEIKSRRSLSDGKNILNLPFSFIFDGYKYDKIQVSSNGWIEFGTGEKGTEHGLSTSSQLDPRFGGGDEANRLISSNRPNKVIAPWWDDLFIKYGLFVGKFSYITEGIPPDRVFVIQWKDVQCSYGTTFLNFQVRLVESTNTIEFHYGNIVPGVYYGAGAMIGLKDHIGGNFHFYDIIAGGLVDHSEAVMNLNPIYNWPGSDSMYVIKTRTSLDGGVEVPTQVILNQNYPNPFNNSTTITYNLPAGEMTHVNLTIYNTLGQKVRNLVNHKQTDGLKSVIWNCKNDMGNNVAAGLYFYVLKAGDKLATKKLIYLR